MMNTNRGASILVYGAPGCGKTNVASTAPKPILNLDVENSSRFLMHIRKIEWNPLEDAPPVYDGTWDMCVVPVNSWAVAQKAYDYLRSGFHPFRSVMVDSISEIQVKAMEAVNGRSKMQTQHWGELLQKMGGLLRDLRDLAGKSNSTLEMVILISTAREIEDSNSPSGSIWKPYLQGSIAQQVPYLFDIVAYMYSVPEADKDTGEIIERRYLFTGKHPNYESKNRVRDFPPVLADPDLSVMMDMIFGPTNSYVEQSSEPTPPPAQQYEQPIEQPTLQNENQSAIVESVGDNVSPQPQDNVAPSLGLDD